MRLRSLPALCHPTSLCEPETFAPAGVISDSCMSGYARHEAGFCVRLVSEFVAAPECCSDPGVALGVLCAAAGTPGQLLLIIHLIGPKRVIYLM